MIEPEKLNFALDLISKGVTRPTKIAKAMGVSYRTYCAWMVKSNSGDERFLVTYNDEVCQWAKAITLATKLALFELRGMILQESIYGYDEIQTKDGQIVWALDPVAAAMSEDEREALGFRRDALLEVKGALVPVTIKRKAPFAQQIRLLEAAFPDLRPTQTVNQNINGAVQVGIGFAGKTDYTQGPPPIPPPPRRPELPAPVDAEFSEVAEENFDDILGPEPAPAPAAAVNININVQQEERTIRDRPTAGETPPPQTGILKPPVDYSAPPTRPARTPLEQSLYDELEKARARKAQA